MKSAPSLRRGAAVSLLAALVAPAAASAHPGVYTVAQQNAAAGCTFPTTNCLTQKTQYAIANDGYAVGVTESNGVRGVQADTTAGMLNFKAMPGSWRAGMSAEDKRTFPAAQTDVQLHATCANSALLDTPANVLAWQQRSDNDPFFNYIPWQKTSAGVGDEPAKWVAVVKRATGVDLATLQSTADFQSACENAPVSGTYHAADTLANITSALVADAQAPLQAQVGVLQNQVSQLQTGISTLQAAKAAAESAAAAAESARPATVNRPLKLTLPGKRFAEAVAMVTGAAGTPVTARMLVSNATAKALHRSSRVLVATSTTLGDQGATLLKLTPSAAAAKALTRRHKAVAVTVEVAGDATTELASGTLTR